MGFFGFYRILPSFYWVLLGFYPIFTRFHLVLQGFTGFFLVLLGFTGFANLPWQRSTVAVGPQPIDSPLIDRFGLRWLFFFLSKTHHSLGRFSFSFITSEGRGGLVVSLETSRRVGRPLHR